MVRYRVDEESMLYVDVWVEEGGGGCGRVLYTGRARV